MVYDASATLVVEDKTLEPEDRPPPVILTLATDSRASEEMAADYITSSVTQMGDYVDVSLDVRNLLIVRRETGFAWWESAFMGAVIGTLMAVAGIYVWDDAKSYLRRQHNRKPRCPICQPVVETLPI